jgi:nuclear GTP-binding protein
MISFNKKISNKECTKDIILKTFTYTFNLTNIKKNFSLKKNFLIDTIPTPQLVLYSGLKKHQTIFDCLKNTEIINRRILNEIFKTLVSSDIICLVLDVRDPIGTWSHILNDKTLSSKKKLIVILNKVDLVPSWIISKWLKIFSKKFSVVAFHSNIKHSFGKNVLLKIIKNIKKENFSKKTVTIGVMGYPNVGKSAFINTIRKKIVTKSSSIPGHTKVWQIIKLSKEIFLIDSPGIIFKKSFNHNLSVFRGQQMFNEKKKEHGIFISLIKKIIGIQIEKKIFSHLKTKRITPFNYEHKRIDKIKKKGKIDNVERKMKFVSDFLSGNIPWYSPCPRTINKSFSPYFFPWILKYDL